MYFGEDSMNNWLLKLQTILKMNIIILLIIVIFVDADVLNEMVINYDDNLVIEEVAYVINNNCSDSELVGEVVVRDETIQSGYITMLNSVSANWVWPTEVPYVITSYYGYRWGSMHGAIDISGPGYGSNIYAANNGIVVTVKDGCVAGNLYCNGKGGNYIVIRHNYNNYYTVYMHMKDIFVNEGQAVEIGEVIGTMGNTGNVVPKPTSSRPYNGTHLHFALYIGEPYNGGYAVNPMGLY